MHSGKYVFAQILSLIDRYEFNKCVKRYNGNFHNRGFDCWNQFVQLLFGQLASLNAMRSISLYLKAHSHQVYHLGIKKRVDPSVLSRANEHRNQQIFADFDNYLIRLVQALYANSPIPNIDLDNEIFALDSTTISVSINLCAWAQGKYARGAVKMHTLLDLHGNIPEYILFTDGRYHDSNALDVIPFCSEAIYLMDKAYNELLVFMTNHCEISALEITLLYQNRWQIEVFFKWIKQNLIIKKFWGYSECS